MTTNLTVTIDDQPVPLDECGWLEREPCGCIVSVVVAVVEAKGGTGWVLATADQARHHFAPKKRDRERAEKAGLTVEHSEAGLYLWATAGEPCRLTVRRLATEGVLVAPGEFYGPAGAQHVRLALTASDERIETAARRLARR